MQQPGTEVMDGTTKALTLRMIHTFPNRLSISLLALHWLRWSFGFANWVRWPHLR